MDDLISREAVKELAHNQVCEKYCGMAFKKHRDFYIKLADSIIDLLPPIQPEIVRCKDCKHWIPVTERLPEYGTEVVTYNRDEEFEINHIIDEEDGEWFLNGAIAWMPLPEPYKGVTE